MGSLEALLQTRPHLKRSVIFKQARMEIQMHNEHFAQTTHVAISSNATVRCGGRDLPNAPLNLLLQYQKLL